MRSKTYSILLKTYFISKKEVIFDLILFNDTLEKTFYINLSISKWFAFKFSYFLDINY
jgi:hypothetical protein